MYCIILTQTELNFHNTVNINIEDSIIITSLRASNLHLGPWAADFIFKKKGKMEIWLSDILSQIFLVLWLM